MTIIVNNNTVMTLVEGRACLGDCEHARSVSTTPEKLSLTSSSTARQCTISITLEYRTVDFRLVVCVMDKRQLEHETGPSTRNRIVGRMTVVCTGSRHYENYSTTFRLILDNPGFITIA